jgi:hypothetical protein
MVASIPKINRYLFGRNRSTGGSPTPGNHTAETGLAGWGARIRTWEWRNQNPPVSHFLSTVILKKLKNSAIFQSTG